MIRNLVFCASFGLSVATSFAQTPASPPPAYAPAAPAPATAPPATPRDWESLSPEQRQVLQGYQGKWNSLPPERQQALAKGSQRWISMTPQQRAGAQQREVRESFNRFRQMPPERRQQLRQQWRQMTPDQRHGAVQPQRLAPPPVHAAPPPHRVPH